MIFADHTALSELVIFGIRFFFPTEVSPSEKAAIVYNFTLEKGIQTFRTGCLLSYPVFIRLYLIRSSYPYDSLPRCALDTQCLSRLQHSIWLTWIFDRTVNTFMPSEPGLTFNQWSPRSVPPHSEV